MLTVCAVVTPVAKVSVRLLPKVPLPSSMVTAALLLVMVTVTGARGALLRPTW